MRLGLLGKSLSHSFSPAYFAKKFSDLKLTSYTYSPFELSEIGLVTGLLAEPDLLGLNVTIPYKEAVIPFLSDLDPHARAIGAVNTIFKTPIGWQGANTDWLGFLQSLDEYAPNFSGSAVVIGNGGASKAVRYALNQRCIEHVVLARNPVENESPLADAEQYTAHKLWINTTPIGQYPLVDEAITLPYTRFSAQHFFYDLVYNPAQTASMKRAQANGANTANGYRMLELQAEASWKIWMDSLIG